MGYVQDKKTINMRNPVKKFNKKPFIARQSYWSKKEAKKEAQKIRVTGKKVRVHKESGFNNLHTVFVEAKKSQKIKK